MPDTASHRERAGAPPREGHLVSGVPEVSARSGVRNGTYGRWSDVKETAMSARFATIVAAVDFSGSSDEAWQVACHLARLTGACLHLLHVCPDPLGQGWAVEAVGVDYEALDREWRAAASQRLARITPTDDLPADRVTRVVVTGSPRRAIVEYASTQRADLIVMGTHGYGPVTHLVLGSVAESVVRHAHCAVLTVPPSAARSAPLSADTASMPATTP